MENGKRPKLATRYTGSREGDRDPVSLEAQCRVGDGDAFEVAVLDLDVFGCRVRGFNAAVTKVDPVEVTLGSLEPVCARLRWAKRGSAGLKFDAPLSEEELDEARESSTPSPVSRVVPLIRSARS